jgi:hypothetical protein
MENLVKKTMTALLVLLTLMIPVSAATVSTPSIAAIENGDDTFTVSFTYTGVSADETMDLTVSGNGVTTQTQTVTLSPVTAGNSGTASATFVAGSVSNGTSITLAVANAPATGDYTALNGTTVTMTVNPETVDELEATLVADNDYEDEVSPGDTIVLELELENGNNVYNDVSLEAYLRDSNGLRVSEVQETSDFNLVAEEEETVTMQFEVEEDLEEGTYEIYVVGTSDEGTLFEETYSVAVEREENSLVVTDLRVSNGATAGETVDVAVTILNNGQTDEDNVLVSLSVAGATVTSDYFTVEEDEELVRYFTMTLPTGASGNEVVTVNVANEDVSVSASSTVNVDAVAQTTSLTEEQVAALLDARLNNNSDANGMSLGWLVAGLLLVYLLVSSKGMMPTTSRATSTSSRGRKSSKKYY